MNEHRKPPGRLPLTCLLIGLAACGLGGCSGDGDGPTGHGVGAGGGRSRGPGGGRGMPPGGGGHAGAAAVPVEVADVTRRDIASYIETQGTLEAENEVDVVARTAGPLVELLAEEGAVVREGDLLARLDDREHRARLLISRVAREETRRVLERARVLRDDDLLSTEEFEQARWNHESAAAQFETDRIQLDYTEIRAPFDGLIVGRYVHRAQQVAAGTPLFRISDFDPLLCPIQVPERDLSRVGPGQPAHLSVEAFPGETFRARVLRVRPVVDAGSGTVKVTLAVRGRGKLRPGMFARVFVQTSTRDDVMVIPKSALALDSLGDVVYVVAGGAATRREVRLGLREGDQVEVLEGLAEGDSIVVVGQDGLSEGTPVQVVDRAGTALAEGGTPPGAGADGAPAAGGGREHAGPTGERLQRMRERMRARGMSDEEIEQRVQAIREAAARGEWPPAGFGRHRPGGRGDERGERAGRGEKRPAGEPDAATTGNGSGGS